MSKQTQAISDDIGQLAEDARALVVATAEDAKEKVGEAREQLTRAVDNSKALCGRARDQAIKGAEVAAAAVRDHPYQAIGIALGLGAILGDLIARRGCRHGD